MEAPHSRWNRRLIIAAAANLLLVGLAGCRPGATQMSIRQATPVVVRGATAITVIALDGSNRQIRYQAPGTPSNSIADVAQQVAAAGWTSEDQAT